MGKRAPEAVLTKTSKQKESTIKKQEMECKERTAQNVKLREYATELEETVRSQNEEIRMLKLKVASKEGSGTISTRPIQALVQDLYKKVVTKYKIYAQS